MIAFIIGIAGIAAVHDAFSDHLADFAFYAQNVVHLNSSSIFLTYSFTLANIELNKKLSIFSLKTSKIMECSVILYMLSIFSIRNKSLNLFNCLLMFEPAMPSIASLWLFLSSFTCSS